MSQNIINISVVTSYDDPQIKVSLKNFNLQIFIFQLWIFQNFTIDKIHSTTKYKNKILLLFLDAFTWTIYINLTNA
jgi:hypothetical protein